VLVIHGVLQISTAPKKCSEEHQQQKKSTAIEKRKENLYGDGSRMSYA
jgi:hypothetical protein